MVSFDEENDLVFLTKKIYQEFKLDLAESDLSFQPSLKSMWRSRTVKYLIGTN